MSNVVTMRKIEAAVKPDLIDLLATVDYDEKNSLAAQLAVKIKESDTPEKLLEWFHSTQDPVSGEFFTGISIDDCKRIMENKKNYVKYGDLLIRAGTY